MQRANGIIVAFNLLVSLRSISSEVNFHHGNSQLWACLPNACQKWPIFKVRINYDRLIWRVLTRREDEQPTQSQISTSILKYTTIKGLILAPEIRKQRANGIIVDSNLLVSLNGLA